MASAVVVTDETRRRCCRWGEEENPRLQCDTIIESDLFLTQTPPSSLTSEHKYRSRPEEWTMKIGSNFTSSRWWHPSSLLYHQQDFVVFIRFDADNKSHALWIYIYDLVSSVLDFYWLANVASSAMSKNRKAAFDAARTARDDHMRRWAYCV